MPAADDCGRVSVAVYYVGVYGVESCTVSVEDKININLNQNLWGLVVAYGALGLGEYYCLGRWFLWPARVLSVCMTFSVVLTVGFYTCYYCKRRWASIRNWKAKELQK